MKVFWINIFLVLVVFCPLSLGADDSVVIENDGMQAEVVEVFFSEGRVIYTLYPNNDLQLPQNSTVVIDGRVVHVPLVESSLIKSPQGALRKTAYLSSTFQNLCKGMVLCLIAFLMFWLSKTIKTAQEA